jgi:hypothetical protein
MDKHDLVRELSNRVAGAVQHKILRGESPYDIIEEARLMTRAVILELTVAEWEMLRPYVVVEDPTKRN